uniref:mannan endo-1,4-beta-mannosidase n=1 Tax=Nelumbo nucifera TaxID=4432 RepID=A0A822XVS4_NELNU|nr:TPA_asm: hypothetical protein HUJ06_027212 [Nelumbo nucifera]
MPQTSIYIAWDKKKEACLKIPLNMATNIYYLLPNFGFLLLAALMIFTQHSSCNHVGVSEDGYLETLVESSGSEDPLPYSTRNYGINHDFGDDEWKMVGKKGKQFIVNDQPFYVNGFNTYWLMVLAADQSTRGKVTELFQQASSVGLTVCRTWAFNDGQWRALQKSPSVYDEEVFKALDFVVSEAKKHKIRLILPLVNNWDAYGGKAQYVKWGKDAGLNLTSNDDFFSNPTLKSYYKAHVKAWIQEMAVYVKSIDPNHLLEIGVEGFYGPSKPDRVQFNPNTYAQQVGTDFIRNHQALGVDFASVHIYADSWISQSISDAHIQFVKSWMQAHIEDAETLGMPVVFGEFGVSAKDGGYNSSFRDTFISTVYKTVLDSTRKGGSGSGTFVWQLFPEGTDYMDDGYAIVLSRSPSTSNIISLQSTRLMIFNSLCSWNCRWSCRKKNALHHFLFPDE